MFIKKPVDQIGVSGGVASFVCQATGDPKPRVTWNKKGKKVNSQRFEVRDALEICVCVCIKRDRLTQSSSCSSLAMLRPDNKGRFGRGGVLKAAGVKCKLLPMSTAGFVPKQERTWLTFLIGVYSFVLLGFCPLLGYNIKLPSSFPEKPQLSWYFFGSVNAPFIPIHGSLL